jgi:hypothetical protein
MPGPLCKLAVEPEPSKMAVGPLILGGLVSGGAALRALGFGRVLVAPLGVNLPVAVAEDDAVIPADIEGLD